MASFSSHPGPKTRISLFYIAKIIIKKSEFTPPPGGKIKFRIFNPKVEVPPSGLSEKERSAEGRVETDPGTVTQVLPSN